MVFAGEKMKKAYILEPDFHTRWMLFARLTDNEREIISVGTQPQETVLNRLVQDKLNKTLPDLILIAANIYDGAGVEFAKTVNTEYPKVAILGMFDTQEEEEAWRQGNVGCYFSKDYLLEQGNLEYTIYKIL